MGMNFKQMARRADFPYGVMAMQLLMEEEGIF